MNTAEAYQINTFSTTFKSEIKRLKAQVELFWDKECELYQQFGLTDGMAVLECGCGPGFLLEKLVSEFPGGQYTGVEIDVHLVDLFQNRIKEKGIQNLNVIQNSIMKTGLPDSSYDMVISRLVLEHLLHPLEAIKELRRVLKPGGKVILIDNDFDFHLRTMPHIEALDELYDAYCRARIAEGGNPKIGRELPLLLEQGGFMDVRLEIISAHSNIIGDTLFLQSEGVGISSKLVKDGYLKASTLDKIATQWSAAVKNKHHLFFRQLFVAAGERPISSKTKYCPKPSSHSATQAPSFSTDAIQNAEPSQQRYQIERYLTALIAMVMDCHPSQIENHIFLDELGFDSLAAVDAQTHIQNELGVYISIATFFEKQNIAGITDSVFEAIFSQKVVSNDQVLRDNKNGALWEEGEI